jgi:hypothetical protein
MVKIDLTKEQSQALKRALEVYLGDLRMEIADTDSQDFREGLKHEKGLLVDVVQQLGGKPSGLVEAAAK